MVAIYGSVAFSHKGYCIESGIFSDRNLLVDFICRALPALQQADVEREVDRLLTAVEAEIRDVGSAFYTAMEERFNSQRGNRPEMANLAINEFVRDLTPPAGFQAYRLMSKPVIAQFVIHFEAALNCTLVQRTDNDPEEISCGLLNKYIEGLTAPDQLFPAYFELIHCVLGLPQAP